MCPLFNHFGVYNSMGVNQWLNLSRIYRSAVMKWPRIGFWLIIASWCWLGVSFGCDWIPRWTATALGGRRSKKKKLDSIQLNEANAWAALGGTGKWTLSTWRRVKLPRRWKNISFHRSANRWMNEWMNGWMQWIDEMKRFASVWNIKLTTPFTRLKTQP